MLIFLLIFCSYILVCFNCYTDLDRHTNCTFDATILLSVHSSNWLQILTMYNVCHMSIVLTFALVAWSWVGTCAGGAARHARVSCMPRRATSFISRRCSSVTGPCLLRVAAILTRSFSHQASASNASFFLPIMLWCLLPLFFLFCRCHFSVWKHIETL